MKYLGPTSDDKDIATKKYVDDAAPIAKLSSKYGLVKPVISGDIYGYNYTSLELQDGSGNTIIRQLASIDEATTSHKGLMPSGDKTKLDGIATGAEVNQNAFSNVKVGSTTISADGKTDTIELVAGNNITLTPDATNDKVTIDASGGGEHIELTQAEYDALSQAEKENGTVYFITDGKPDYTIINDSVPIGAVQAYAGVALPYGWLFCDGSAVSRETYSELFDVIGTAYGPGDGSTTFNLPDLRGRTLIGVGNNGATGATTHTLGQKDGEETHYHEYGIIYGGYFAAVNIENQPFGVIDLQTSSSAVKPHTILGSQTYSINNAATTAAKSVTANINTSMGTTSSSSNMQPYIVANYIIKALNTVSSSALEELDPQSIIFDIFYPVGSYYETSDSTFNPNVQWRGTWVLETAGQVHVSAGSGYTIGDTGGEATHTLNSTEMPAHNHVTPAVGIVSGTSTSVPRSSSNFTMTSFWNLITVNASSPTRYDSYGPGNFTSNNTGDSQPHNNMQPYIVVNRWHRIA